MSVTTVQIRQKGVITLPAELRRQYGLHEGDLFTLTDLGEGSFLLTPHVSNVARLGDMAARAIADAGISVDEMLEALDREREEYYRQHYAGA